MRITDRFVIKDKASEKTIRDLDFLVEQMGNSNTLKRAEFTELHSTIVELFITVFKRLDNNTTPARTLLDFTGIEVQDACLRVGDSKNFQFDRDYVIAVMQELTK